MKKIMYILRKRPGILLFIIAAIAGASLIFLFLGGIEKDGGDAGVLSKETADIEVDKNEDEQGNGIYKRRLAIKVPTGMKAVNLPVNFFGDYSVLHEGDRVDIISTYYNSETGILGSEKIISEKTIVAVTSLASMIFSLVSSLPFKIMSMTCGEWNRSRRLLNRSSSRICSLRLACSMIMAI